MGQPLTTVPCMVLYRHMSNITTSVKAGERTHLEEDQRVLRINRAFLVYQAGIANVFMVECANLAPFGREAKRLMQGDFRTCEAYARGLADAGVYVHSAACNRAGDIRDEQWTYDLDSQPFSNKFRPMTATRGF